MHYVKAQRSCTDTFTVADIEYNDVHSTLIEFIFIKFKLFTCDCSTCWHFFLDKRFDWNQQKTQKTYYAYTKYTIYIENRKKDISYTVLIKV